MISLIKHLYRYHHIEMSHYLVKEAPISAICKINLIVCNSIYKWFWWRLISLIVVLGFIISSMLVLGFIQDTYLLVSRGKIFYSRSNGICSSYNWWTIGCTGLYNANGTNLHVFCLEHFIGYLILGAISDRSMSTQRYEYRYLVLIFKNVNLYQTIALLER